MPEIPPSVPGKIRTEGINFVESAAGVVRGNGSKNTSFIRRVVRPWATREMEENIWPQKIRSRKQNAPHSCEVRKAVCRCDLFGKH